MADTDELEDGSVTKRLDQVLPKPLQLLYTVGFVRDLNLVRLKSCANGGGGGDISRHVADNFNIHSDLRSALQPKHVRPLIQDADSGERLLPSTPRTMRARLDCKQVSSGARRAERPRGVSWHQMMPSNAYIHTRSFVTR